MIENIAVSKLTLSPLNARQATDPATVQDLMASIQSIGLKQNLCVTKTGTARKPQFEVVAGGRRLLALQTLLAQGALPKAQAVACEVVDEAQAVEVSIAENTQREDMSAVEEFRAFAALSKNGIEVEDIAARFGVSPLVVQRRLKLAAVAPSLIALCEQGAMSLEQLMAFTVSDDTEQQVRVWENAPQWDRHAANIRRLLTDSKVRADADPRVKAVGLDAYQAAGGTLTHDLFADHGGYVDDIELIQKLFNEKVEAAAAAARANGWKVSVESEPMESYELGRTYFHMEPELGPLKKQDAKRLADLEKQLQALNTIIEEQTDKYHEEDADDEAIEAELERLEGEAQPIEDAIEALQKARRVWTDAHKENGLAVVFLSRDGVLKTLEGMTTRKQTRTVVTASGETVEQVQDKPFHTKKLVNVLSTERTLAMQALMIQDPELAQLAALERMASTVIDRSYSDRSAYRLGVALDVASYSCIEVLPDGSESKAADVVAGAVAQWQNHWEAFTGGKKASGSILDWLKTLSTAERFELQAVCVAVTFDARSEVDAGAGNIGIEREAGLDMTQWWTPSVARYFGHQSKRNMLTILNENGIDTNGLDKLKTSELASKAAELMQAHAPAWLPSPLQG